MTPSKKYYLGAIFLFAALFVGNLFLQHGLAWTNPTSNPPTASPTIITSGSNVGIGTTPSYKLDVSGTARVSSDLAVGGELSFGVSGTRTQTKQDAGAQGGKSGFYEASAPVNYPTGASSWWHLLDVRHSNTSNNYAMQFAGSFFDQNLWFRKTNNSGSTAWQRVLTTADAVGGVDGSGTANYIPKFTAGTTLGNSQIMDDGTTVTIPNTLSVGGTGSNFGTTGAYIGTQTPTLGVSELTSSNNRLPWLQFHTGGYQEAFIRLARNTRVFEMGDSQNVGVDLALLNGAGTQNVYLSPRGTSYFNGGNVGIGTTNPQATLSVGGNGLVNYGIYSKGSASGVYGEGSTGYGVFGYATTGTGVNGMSTSYRGVTGDSNSGIGGYFTSGSGYALITGNGNVGIGTANPAYKLDVSGDIRTSGAVRTPSGSVKPPIVYYVNLPLDWGSGSRVLVSKDINVTSDMVGQPIWIDMGVKVNASSQNAMIGLDGFTVLKNGVLFPLSSDNGPYYQRVADYYNGISYSWNLRNSYFFSPDATGTYNISIKGYGAVNTQWLYLKMIIQAGTNNW